MNKKNILLMVIIAAGLALFYMLSRSAADISPEQVMKTLFDLNAPTRYAFISDAASKRVSVVDIYAKNVIDTIELKEIPEAFVISPRQKLMAYAAKGGKTLHLRHLTSHEERSLDLPHPIEQLFFHYSKQLLVAAGDHSVSLVNSETPQVLETLDSFQAPIRINYASLLDTVWLSESATGTLYQLRIDEDGHFQVPRRFVLDAQERRLGQPMLSSDSNFIALAAHDLGEGWIFDIQSEKLLYRYPVGGEMTLPLIDAGSIHSIFMNREGRGVIVASAAPEAPHFVQSLPNVQVLATGWIETRLLVGGDQGIELIDLNDEHSIRILPVAQGLRDLLVAADSKTVLYTEQQGAQLRIHSLNLKNNAPVESVDLPLQQPNFIKMGVSNTVCH